MITAETNIFLNKNIFRPQVEAFQMNSLNSVKSSLKINKDAIIPIFFFSFSLLYLLFSLSFFLLLWKDNFDFRGKIVAKFLLKKHFLSIYDNKIALTMGTFKKYVTWIMIFFIPFTCVTLCKLYFKTPCIIKNIKLCNERNEDFLYV